MSWDFSTDSEYLEQLGWARHLVDEHIIPLETLGLEHRTFRELVKPLQSEVRQRGLWAAHLGPELGGQGYGQIKLGLLNEVLGRCELAPYVFGCQAPDTGNAEILALAGTADQKERWLTPLLDTKILSCFAMTEQGTGSDPRQLEATAIIDNDCWVLNGHKWFATNANRSAFHIVMAATEPRAEGIRAFSMILVPSDSAGIEMREIPVMSDDRGPATAFTHCEVWYRDVRVPVQNILGSRGDGFLLAQKRLGPGRIHHCMRWIGMASRAFDMLCERAVSITLHGQPLAEKQMVQSWVADSAVEIEAARLLTMKAAWHMDRVGSSGSRVEIAMIKFFGAKVLLDVIDRAIQVHGSLGYSRDMPLEAMYRIARAARIYDGPDEVHRVTVARKLLQGYQPVEVPAEHVPTRRHAAQTQYAAQLEALGI
jgi:acyl-CoA dehydrogenase